MQLVRKRWSVLPETINGSWLATIQHEGTMKEGSTPERAWLTEVVVEETMSPAKTSTPSAGSDATASRPATLELEAVRRVKTATSLFAHAPFLIRRTAHC